MEIAYLEEDIESGQTDNEGAIPKNILYAGENTFVKRFLSFKVFVWVGLISYSAYLWHQPIFAFVRLKSITEPELMDML